MHYELFKQQEDVPKEHPLVIYMKAALPTSYFLLLTTYFLLPTISAIYPTIRRKYVAKGYRFAVAIPSGSRQER
jgi:hypothetical protein